MGMSQQEIDHVLSQGNNAIVGVNRSGGRAPQLTVIWYAWDGTTFYFSTTKDRAKYLNIKRNASISLVVDDPESHKYIVAYGQAEILEQQTGEKTRLILQKYVPADQLERRVQAIEADSSRVIIALRPEKILTN
jgi:PPOX class probable F420-dependent enzyme